MSANVSSSWWFRALAVFAPLGAGCGAIELGAQDASRAAEDGGGGDAADVGPSDAGPSQGLGDAAGGATYRAYYVARALESFAIVKSDPQRGLCFYVFFVSPGSPAPSGVTVSLPSPWTVATAPVGLTGRVCETTPYAPEGSHAAARATGRVDWPDAGVWTPNAVSRVDLTLEFDAGGLPAQERLRVDDLPIQR